MLHKKSLAGPCPWFLGGRPSPWKLFNYSLWVLRACANEVTPGGPLDSSRRGTGHAERPARWVQRFELLSHVKSPRPLGRTGLETEFTWPVIQSIIPTYETPIKTLKTEALMSFLVGDVHQCAGRGSGQRTWKLRVWDPLDMTIYVSSSGWLWFAPLANYLTQRGSNYQICSQMVRTAGGLGTRAYGWCLRYRHHVEEYVLGSPRQNCIAMNNF